MHCQMTRNTFQRRGEEESPADSSRHIEIQDLRQPTETASKPSRTTILVANTGKHPVADDILLQFNETPPAGRALFVEEAALNDALSPADKKRLYEQTLRDESPQMPKARSELIDTIAAQDPLYGIKALGELVTVAPVGDFLGIGGRDSLAQTLAPHRKSLLQACEKWLGSAPTPLLVLQVADILENAFGSDEVQLIDAVDAWLSKTDSHKFIVLEILHKTLTRHVRDQGHPAALKAQSLTLAIAKAAGRTVGSAVSGIRDSYVGAMALAKELKRPPPTLNWVQLQENLKAVPSLVTFLGPGFQKILAAQTDHPLARMLHSRPPPQSRLDQGALRFKAAKTPSERAGAALFYRYNAGERNWLPYVEEVFSRLPSNMGTLRRNLLNPTQTIDTWCEAELLGRAGRTLKVEAEATGNGFTTPRDARIRCPSGSVVLEVYNPKPDPILMVAQGAVTLDPDLLMKKVRSKFRDQLKSQAPTEPLVLVIHGGQGPFDEWDVERILLGSQKTTVWMDNKTGQAVRVQDHHDADALGDEDPTSAIISAVLLYRRDLAATPPVLELRLVPNPNAKTALTPGLKKELLDALG